MKKTKYTSRFKFDRVIESVRKDNVSEVARSYGFGINLLSKWRSDFLKNGHKHFDTKTDQDVIKL